VDPLQTAYNFFVGQGASPSAAAGIAAGLYAESAGTLSPSELNQQGSGAYGIGQWLGGRQQALFAEYGSSPSFLQELQFVWQELTGSAPNDSGAVSSSEANSILNASSPQSALQAFIGGFERPCTGGPGTSCYGASLDLTSGSSALNSLNIGASPVGGSLLTPSIDNAIQSGESAFGIGAMAIAENPIGSLSTIGGMFAANPLQTAGQVLGAGVANTAGVGANVVTGNISAAVASGVGSAVAPLTSWLTGLTSMTTVTRVSVGLVAIILLLAGIFFLANNKQITLNVPNIRGAT
jgi:hypothetical protein